MMEHRVILALIAAFAFAVPAVQATHGVDVSQYTSKDSWSCMKREGIVFAIVRAYQSFGRPDPNAVASIKNAHAAGIKYVDGYIFPCFKCGNAAGQARAARDNLKNHGAHFGMLWMDIEGPQYWGDRKANINFIAEMAEELHRLGVNFGVYTSASQWDPITGGWTGLKDRPLWYAHYDGRASFSDFVPFGGWHKPAIKQYEGSESLCGAGVDRNWYP